MSELICGLDNSLISITKKCLSCTQSCKKVMETYITCPHIRVSDNLAQNTVFPYVEGDVAEPSVNQSQAFPTRSSVTTVPEVDNPKYDASVWDNGRPKITSPVFSIPRKVELIEI